MKNNFLRLKAHFIGIGGIGVSAVAKLFHESGAVVTGSDLIQNEKIETLRTLGLKITIGHSKKNITNSDIVIYSGAIKPSNIEYKEALFQKIPLISRAEALSKLMDSKRNIIITGSHGKTTTTSLIVSLFLKAKKDPSYAIGGTLRSSSLSSHLGEGNWFIVEADESDGSLKHFSPEILVITNIDREHLDYYKNLDQLKKSLYHLASRLPSYGSLIVCGDDKNITSLFSKNKKNNSFNEKSFSQIDSINFKDPLSNSNINSFPKILHYGFKETNDYILKRNQKTHHHYTVYSSFSSQELFSFSPSLPGDQNALNALAASLVAFHARIDIETCKKGIENFGGVLRRIDYKGQKRKIDFFDDYGHHPTEIKALLKTFKEKYPRRRLIVLFQPHRFSRTRLCWKEFLSCFNEAHKVFVLDIFGAGETPIKGINSKKFCESYEKATYIPEEKIPLLKKELKPKDIFLTLGAGDVWKWGEKIHFNL